MLQRGIAWDETDINDCKTPLMAGAAHSALVSTAAVSVDITHSADVSF